ncbi:MFS transporter [Acidiferrimicrobium sp. IK]|uniref:MFS transporter n=1 Tax=Acidiferrimicrobium sp. IK TaxID=2871700 RepID=UPI0021CB91A3|nr:MFS transporter [Acidiferrimicrobium sp. IK]MCU4183651.1 MFS transporter [Acidiferrimicrobium sp. IK]
MSTTTVQDGSGARPRPSFMSSIGRRQLEHYPESGMRYFQLALVVVVTVVLYYENYVGSGVAPQLLANLHMSFTYYVVSLAIANGVGALASVAAGLADRLGRTNLVVYGVAVTGVIMAFGLPNSHSKLVFVTLSIIIGLVEGMVLVATPALVRDFSPQVGRATAMGFWTMGPVLGSLAVSVVATQTLPTVNPDWQGQFQVCGAVGLAAFVLAFIFLRELSPQLRDQLMVDLKERELIEARAKGIDVEASLQHPFRQMVHADVLVSALGISLLLLIYYTAVAFGAVFLETVFGFSANQANGIGNWNWAVDAAALLVVGLVSDRLRVRKPFMVIGGVGAAVMIVIYLLKATHHPSYHTVALIVSLLAVALGCAFAPWMASFTETVEARNPALTATGLAIWGLTLRIVVFAAFLVLPAIVTSTSPLVDQGPRVQALATKYAAQLATAAKLDKSTSAALAANPTDPATQVKALSEISGKSVAQVAAVVTASTVYAQQVATLGAVDQATLLQAQAGNTAAQASAVAQIAKKFNIGVPEATQRLIALSKVPQSTLVALATSGAAVQSAAAQLKALGAVPVSDLSYLQAHAASVQKASKDAPHQWQDWYWVCFAGAVIFVPATLLMKGRWSPKKAKADAEAHEAVVAEQLAALRAARA